MNVNNKITNYFRVVSKKETPVAAISEKRTEDNNPADNTSDKTHVKSLNNSRISSSDGSDDCIIIENEVTVINLVEDEEIFTSNGEEKENDSKMDILLQNSLKSNKYSQPCLENNTNKQLTKKQLPKDSGKNKKIERMETMDEGKDDDLDIIMSSQEGETVPDDNLDESFLSLEESDSTIILSPEKNYNSLSTIEHNRNTSKINKRQRKRVVIKKDYMTKFMCQMVKRFLRKTELHNLFTEEDLTIIKLFHNVKSVGAQVLFARMYWLTQCYKQTSKVVSKYLHINFKCKAVTRMIESLKNAKLFYDERLDILTWCGLLSRAELINHLKNILKHKRLSQMSKNDIIDAVKGACQPKNDISKHFIQAGRKPMVTPAKTQIEKLYSNDDYIMVHPKGRDVFDRLHLLMYTGVNPQILRDKKLNLLLLNVKRNLQHYPAMELKCDSIACLFPTREYFEAYVEAYHDFERHYSHHVERSKQGNECDIAELNCKITTIRSNLQISQFDPPVWHHRYSPLYIYYKTVEMCVSSTRADKDHCSRAVETLRTLLMEDKIRAHKKFLWYTELVTCHWKLREHADAAQVLEEALTNPALSLVDKTPLCDKAQRLAQMKVAKLNETTRNKLLELSHQTNPEISHIKICGQMLENTRNKRPTYRIFDSSTGDVIYANVEDFAIHHYTSKLSFSRGEHWEGSIVTSIFALVFWDIIYHEMPGKGVFVSPFQELPLDMFTPAFYHNRKEIIEERLEWLKDSKICDVIERIQIVYEARKIGDFSLYNEKISLITLCEVVKCLGNIGLHAICKRLAYNYHVTHSGFPDLTVWDPVTGKIKFVEVKSHNDRLSFKQICWIQYMIDSGVHTEVCFVFPNETDMELSGKINKPSSSSMTEVQEKKERKKASKKKRKNIQTRSENEEVKSTNINFKSSNVGVKRKSQRITRNSTKAMKLDENYKSDDKESNLVQNVIKQHKVGRAKKTKNLVASVNKNSSSSDFEINSPRKLNATIVDALSPKKTSTPLKSGLSSSSSSPRNSVADPDGVYLRSPTKFTKGVGYFVSPTKSQQSPVSGQSKSPYKNLSPKRKISLSLTRRRLTDFDK